jgi:hypothetical protein
MNDNLESILLAPAGLYLPLVAALVLTLVRAPQAERSERIKLVGVFLIGTACQCLHVIEEFVFGFHELFPPLFGLDPISAELFVGFNVFWLGIWALAAFGMLRNSRIAYFPVWFFGLAMCLNGIAHPLLSVWTGGYFPGLITSPLAGIMGIIITKKLVQNTVSGLIEVGS